MCLLARSILRRALANGFSQTSGLDRSSRLPQSPRCSALRSQQWPHPRHQSPDKQHSVAARLRLVVAGASRRTSQWCRAGLIAVAPGFRSLHVRNRRIAGSKLKRPHVLYRSCSRRRNMPSFIQQDDPPGIWLILQLGWSCHRFFGLRFGRCALSSACSSSRRFISCRVLAARKTSSHGTGNFSSIPDN
jgi:hypothetical protein